MLTMDTSTKLDSCSSCEVLKVSQVSAYLGLSEQTIYQYASAGKIPSVKIGSNLRFLPEDLAAWIRSKRVGIEVQANE